ncbi:MAG: glutaredoxin family protein, partial [Geodermatophilaceae bacterium]
MLKPDDRVVVYMRPGCHVCARVKSFLTEHEVPFHARDVDSDPLTPREFWDLFNRKANRLRVPFTALNDGEDVVLGFDPQRLEGVFVHGELGG